MDWLVFLGVVAALIIGVIFLVGILRTRVEFVEEGRKAVIYQMGRFHRLDGPGKVVLNKRVDKIHHQIDIRNMPRDHAVDALSYGVPFTYSVNFWRKVDLISAAGGSRERLIEMAIFTDAERQQQMNTILRDTLVQTLASMERDYPLPVNTELVRKILPILPGIPQCEEMLARWKLALRRNLPKVGVYLDPEYPLVVKRVVLGEEITSSLSLRRRSELLRSAMPGVSEELLLQALTVIAGYEPPQHINKLQLDSNHAARVEVRPDQDGEIATRIKIDATPAAKEPTAAAPAPAQTSAKAPKPEQDEHLSAEDLAVLKPIPSYHQRQSQTG